MFSMSSIPEMVSKCNPEDTFWWMMELWFELYCMLLEISLWNSKDILTLLFVHTDRVQLTCHKQKWAVSPVYMNPIDTAMIPLYWLVQHIFCRDCFKENLG